MLILFNTPFLKNGDHKGKFEINESFMTLQDITLLVSMAGFSEVYLIEM